MKKISTEDIKELEVINLCGGGRLGYPEEFEIDLECGNVLGMFVKSCNGGSFFGKKDEIYVPWCKIECFGDDAILVKLQVSDMPANDCCKSSKKRGFFR